MSEVLEHPEAAAAESPACRKPSARLTLVKAAQRDLLKALQSVSGIVERRQMLPILGNVLLTKEGRSLQFTTTDMEHQMRADTELGAGDSKARTTVAARKLVDILRSMPEEQAITLTLDDERLVVSGGRARFTLRTLPADDFPLVAQAPDYGAPIGMPQKTLRRLIGQVHYSMAICDIRYYLNAMLLQTQGGIARVVATDGHRLAVAEAALDAPADERSVIIPRKAVAELHRLLKDDDAPVEIRLAGTQACFTFSGLEFVTKLVDGRFPDHARVLPTAVTTSVTFERETLLHSLQRAELMSSERLHSVELAFSAQRLEIKVGNGEETAHEELGIDYAGERLSIGFNVLYLIAALQHVEADTVTVGLRTANECILITQPNDPGFRAVVMPMRI